MTAAAPASFTLTSFDGAGSEPARVPTHPTAPPALTRRIAESFDGMTPWGWPLFWQAWQDSTIPGPGGYPYRGATGTVTDRQYGRDLPFFWTEMELRGYRTVARYLCETNPFAIGFVELLADYHVRKGFGWQACLKGHKKAAYATATTENVDPLVAKAQQILDEFRDRNNWPLQSWEAFVRLRRDGEVFGRVFRGASGHVPVFRFVEPEQVGAPDGATNEPWSYGIDCLEYEDGKIDSQHVLAYHVWDMEGGMTEGEWVEAAEVVHAKANVDSTVKRGRPDFFALTDEFDSIRRLLRNMIVTAADQAAIAWLEKFPTATAAQVGGIIPQQTVAPGQTQDVSGFPGNGIWPGMAGYYGAYPPTGGNRYRPGSIYRTEGNREIDPGPTSTGTESFVKVEQAVLRALGSRWRFPEYFSGDASNNNLASSIVAGSPFTVGVECSQERYGATWERPVALRVLDRAVETGRLSREERAKLDVEVTSPAVISPKPNEDAAMYGQLIDKKVVCLDTARQKLGYDPKHEAEGVQKDSQTAQAQAPPGLGGDMGGGGERPPGAPDLSELLGEEVVSEGAPPGGPPRPGLQWNDTTHRWRNPETGEEHEHPQGKPSASMSSRKRPQGFKEWAQIGQAYTEGQMAAVAKAVIAHGEHTDPGFREAVEWQAQQTASQVPGNLKALKSRPQLILAMTAMEQLAQDEATRLSNSENADEVGKDRGASAGHRISDRHENHGWRVAASIADAALEGGSRQESRAVLLENFTGTVTDSAGHKRHYVNGKQVANPPEQPAPAEPSSPEEHAAGLFVKLSKLGGKVAAVAKLVGDKATALALKATELMAKYGLDPADILTTPADESKLINDRAVGAQVGDALGMPVNSAVVAVVSKLYAFGVAKLKAALKGKVGEPKPSESDKTAGKVGFWTEALAHVFEGTGIPAPDKDGVTAWLSAA